MACPICDDTGWKPIDDPTTGVRRVIRCDCWRERVGIDRLATANIPKRYQHCTLDNFAAYNETLEKAVAHAKRVADAFPVVSRGLLLEGQPGVGKTHLAVAVLKMVIERTGAYGLFYDTRDLLRVIRSTYDPSIRTTELEILRPVMRADLLVLDDLGAEDLRVGRGDDEPDRQHPLQRATNDAVHVELSRHPGRRRSELAAVPDRPPDAVETARNV
jgi:DNA replication protein DnaC